MASLRDIRRRIRSVSSTEQITKAMQAVSAARMHRAQAQVAASRPYRDQIDQVLGAVAARAKEYKHPFLVERDGTRGLLVLVTSDRGLCGALNVNVIRAANQYMRGHFDSDYQVIVVGRKGRAWARRFGHREVAEVTALGDRPPVEEVRAVAQVAMEQFMSGQVDAVVLAYAKHISALVQEPVVGTLIPVAPQDQGQGPILGDYIYEPGAREVLDQLLPRCVEAHIYQAVLENLASEHSARMVAMRNASKAAGDLIRQLTLTANKVRQATITRELMEIVGGAEALRAQRR